MMARRILGIAAVLFWITASARGVDWYRWRGPGLNGISTESGWVADFPASGPKRLWKAQVGTGFSSVVVSDGRLFTMGNRADVDSVCCFDAESGKELWVHRYPCPTDPRYYEGGTSATPTVDGNVVYTISRKGDLFSFRADSGKVIWSKNIAKALDLKLPEWGFAGSPLVQGDLLLLNVGRYGAGLKKQSGELVWLTGKEASGYSTPVPFKLNGRDALLIFGAKALAAVGLDGKVFWEFPWKTQYDVNAADPIISGDKIFISSGYRSGGALLKLVNGRPELEWQNQNMHNQLNGCLLMDGYLYGVSGQSGYAGDLRCVDLATGEVKWKELSVGLGAVTAADGKLIVAGEKGELIIAEATPREFQAISGAQVLGGKNWTVPVLSNGLIYCRNSTGDLVCVDVRPAKSTSSQNSH